MKKHHGEREDSMRSRVVKIRELISLLVTVKVRGIH
jgi:hypothetical protein